MNEDSKQESALSVALFGDWAVEYNRQLNLLFKQLIQLNSTYFILRKIAEFPFELFPHKDNHFWSFCLFSMFETCVSCIHRISFDSDSKSVTLSSFKNNCMVNFVSNHQRTACARSLKRVGFQDRMSTVIQQVKELRHKRIAHLDRDFNLGKIPDMETRSLTVDDLQVPIDAMNQFFDVLCFGHYHRKVLGDYANDISSPVGTDPRSDIEMLLDRIAMGSGILNMPEQQPEQWQAYRDNPDWPSPSDIEMINRYRVKFGMKEVP